MKGFGTLSLIMLGLLSSVFAQMPGIRDSTVTAPLIGLNYAYHLPLADMDIRFGGSNSVGITFLVKTKKNLVFGADWNYIFGNTINEPGLLQNLKNSQGQIVAKTGETAQIKLYERGQYSSLKIGKLFKMPWSNKNSGFLLMLTAGGLMHKIRIDVNDNNVDALNKEYKKGYDRLTSGLAVGQFVGYLFLSNNRLINLFAGFEVIEGFTKGRRSFNFDTMEKDNKPRFDVLYGLKVGLAIPLYKRLPQEYYYD
jgi:hypothetical protein